jgi:hypothetical protein
MALLDSRKNKIMVLLLIWSFWIVKTEAHPMPNSIVELFVRKQFINGIASIPIAELENAINNKDSIRIKAYLKHYFYKHIKARSNHTIWKVSIDSIDFETNTDKIVGRYEEVKVYFSLFPPQEELLRNFTFLYDAVVHQVITHSILVILSEDWQNGIHQEVEKRELGVINYNVVNSKIFPLNISLQKGSKWKGFYSMIQMGILHIKDGTDHLLFLITLLLPSFLITNKNTRSTYAGFKIGFYRTIKLITAFTLGHSITLMAGAVNLFLIPTQLIEVLIAFSILVSAIHCIIPFFFHREYIVAIGFGFIHGLAFSQALQFLQLEKIDLIISVLGFNLGIEIMQLLIIIITIPWFALLSQTIFFISVKNMLAVCISIASIGWIIQRLNDKPNFLSDIVNKLLLNSIWLIILIAIISIALFLLDKSLTKTKKSGNCLASKRV